MNKKTRSAISETLLLTAALLASGFLLHPRDPFFITTTLNPYWIVILMVSLRYGSPMGFIAGLLAAIIYLTGLHQQGIAIHRLLNLHITQALQPLLYMGVGLAVGSTINMHRKRNARQRQNIDDLQGQIHAIETKRLEMEQAYRTIERQVAGDNQTLVDFANDLQALEVPDAQAIYTALIDILKRQLNADRCEIWEQTSRGAYRQILCGNDRSPLPLLGMEVLRTRSTLTVRDMIFADIECTPDDGIIAGPLFNNEVNIMAVVVIRAIPFRKLSYSALARFETLLKWASRALHKVYLQTLSESALRGKADIEMLPSDDFMQFCQTELDMIGGTTPSTFMFCRMPDKLDGPPLERMVTAVGRIIRYQTHHHDAMMWHEPSHSFVLFMPATPVEAAHMLRERFAFYLSLYDLEPQSGIPLQLEYTILDCTRSDDIDEVIYRLREREVTP